VEFTALKLRLEPTTLRLTAERLEAASRCKHKAYTRKNRVLPEFGGTLGGLLQTRPAVGIGRDKVKHLVLFPVAVMPALGLQAAHSVRNRPKCILVASRVPGSMVQFVGIDMAGGISLAFFCSSTRQLTGGAPSRDQWPRPTSD
jgi:hypothetical protein